MKETMVPDTSKHRFQFSIRTLLLSFIPVALVAGLATWLFRPPPIDVAITVERFYWYKAVDENGDENGVGLGAEVRITNRSRNTVWYMENPRWCLLQIVDGNLLTSSYGTSPPRTPGKAEQDWWSAQDGMQTVTISVGSISEKATSLKVVIPFTTDRFMPKRHWVSSPEVKIVKKGKDYFPETEEGAVSTQCLNAPTIISRDLKK